MNIITSLVSTNVKASSEHNLRNDLRKFCTTQRFDDESIYCGDGKRQIVRMYDVQSKWTDTQPCIFMRNVELLRCAVRVLQVHMFLYVTLRLKVFMYTIKLLFQVMLKLFHVVFIRWNAFGGMSIFHLRYMQ